MTIILSDLQVNEERATTFPPVPDTSAGKRVGSNICLENMTKLQTYYSSSKEWSICARFICIQHSATVYSQCKK